MTLVTLKDVLEPALSGSYAVAGLVTLGWEDMRAYVEAAELEQVPVILQAGPSCRAHTPLPILGKMFRHLAESASVPVVAHLDHGYTFDECQEALDSGFTSVMFDGSRKPLQQNIDETAQVAELAHQAGISCEGEIGFVGYSGGENSSGTDPSEAAKFAVDSHVNAMAISVGNTHLQLDKNTNVDIQDIVAVQNLTDTALVLHGGSGIDLLLRAKIARETNVCKFNIGTELRKTFGDSLRVSLKNNPETYDKIQLLDSTANDIKKATKIVIENLSKV